MRIGAILLLWVLAMMIALSGRADIIKVSELSLEYKQFQGHNYSLFINPQMPGREPNEELDLNVNLDILRYLYVNNTVHSLTDRPENASGTPGQFRTVGWHWQVGAHLGNFDLYLDHFSQHILDTSWPGGSFPIENSVGVKWYIVRPDATL